MRASARMRQKQWVVRPQDGRCADFAKSLGVSPLVAQVLLNRQISDADSGAMFLNPKLTDLISPELMPGIAGAVARIKKAISGKEKITIYGDYDVDGITGVSILWEVIKLLGGNADFYIPHRVDEGYGLNKEAIEMFAGQGIQLIITVDCGITAVES
ncbi:MAG: DHH family phosphoesterase, partial [Phycisphaerae bacterium]|nr:DHH family phosphoesterase [Phycisphaerae bacterium]